MPIFWNIEIIARNLFAGFFFLAFILNMPIIGLVLFHFATWEYDEIKEEMNYAEFLWEWAEAEGYSVYPHELMELLAKDEALRDANRASTAPIDLLAGELFREQSRFTKGVGTMGVYSDWKETQEVSEKVKKEDEDISGHFTPEWGGIETPLFENQLSLEDTYPVLIDTNSNSYYDVILFITKIIIKLDKDKNMAEGSDLKLKEMEDFFESKNNESKLSGGVASEFVKLYDWLDIMERAAHDWITDSELGDYDLEYPLNNWELLIFRFLAGNSVDNNSINFFKREKNYRKQKLHYNLTKVLNTSIFLNKYLESNLRQIDKLEFFGNFDPFAMKSLDLEIGKINFDEILINN